MCSFCSLVELTTSLFWTHVACASIQRCTLPGPPLFSLLSTLNVTSMVREALGFHAPVWGDPPGVAGAFGKKIWGGQGEKRMQLFLLTIGSFLLAVEFFYTCNWSFFAYNWSFILTIEAFLAYRPSKLQWESASNKHLKWTVSKEAQL